MRWRSKERVKDRQQHEFTGFLEKGVRFEGTLEASGVFRIDAHVKGNVISSHSLILGEGARVEGQIEGNHVVIAGKFDGVIFAKFKVTPERCRSIAVSRTDSCSRSRRAEEIATVLPTCPATHC